MTNALPYYCLFIAIILPYLTAGASVYYRIAQQGSVNNKQPRAQAAQLEGAGARIVAAQHNAWEALVVFAVAIYIATVAGVEPQTINQASMVFVGARIVYPLFYVADIAVLRSLSFAVGLGSCLYLIITALF